MLRGGSQHFLNGVNTRGVVPCFDQGLQVPAGAAPHVQHPAPRGKRQREVLRCRAAGRHIVRGELRRARLVELDGGRIHQQTAGPIRTGTPLDRAVVYPRSSVCESRCKRCETRPQPTSSLTEPDDACRDALSSDSTREVPRSTSVIEPPKGLRDSCLTPMRAATDSPTVDTHQGFGVHYWGLLPKWRR